MELVWGQQRQKPSTTRAKNKNSSLSSSDGHDQDDLSTTSPGRALVERVGNEAGEDSQAVHMRRIAALMAECEDTTTSDAIAEARRKHLEKLTNVKDKVVPRTDHQTPDRTLGGQCARRRREEGQVDDSWVRANSERKRGCLLGDLKMMLAGAALRWHVADGSESQVWIEPPEETELGRDYTWEPCQHSQH